MYQQTLEIHTTGRGFTEITAAVNGIIQSAGIGDGLCHLFIHHTSAGLVITENADPDVLADLETWISDIAPDGDSRFRHNDEGPDDMPAHVRTLLTDTALTVPVSGGRLGLGTWQGVFVWEHRKNPHARKVTVSVI